MSEQSFDPDTQITGFILTYGDVKNGGNCWGMMPAIFRERTVQTGERYAETEEEYELYGAHLPAEIIEMVDIEIGCENYQALVAAGVAVDNCVNCPLLKSNLG